MTKNKEKLTNEEMLKRFIDMYGIGPVIQDQLSDVNPEMTLGEFTEMLIKNGIFEYANEMTLKDLFHIDSNARKSEPRVLKQNIIDTLAASSNTDLTVAEIGETLGENSKHISVAIAALKKAGKVVGIGEKRNMRYCLANDSEK